MEQGELIPGILHREPRKKRRNPRLRSRSDIRHELAAVYRQLINIKRIHVVPDAQIRVWGLQLQTLKVMLGDYREDEVEARIGELEGKLGAIGYGAILPKRADVIGLEKANS